MIPTSFFDSISLHPCLACNNPTNDYVAQCNLDSHNKKCMHAAVTRSHKNSEVLSSGWHISRFQWPKHPQIPFGNYYSSSRPYSPTPPGMQLIYILTMHFQPCPMSPCQWHLLLLWSCLQQHPQWQMSLSKKFPQQSRLFLFNSCPHLYESV
jgi:hypothetical protein